MTSLSSSSQENGEIPHPWAPPSIPEMLHPWRCSRPGWGVLEHPGLVKGVPAPGKGVGLCELTKTKTFPWFHDNSPSMVNEENHVSELTFLPFCWLPVLNGMIHLNVFSIYCGALLGLSRAVTAPWGIQHLLSFLDSPKILSFKAGIDLGREELCCISFIDVFVLLWLLSGLRWLGELA